MSSDLALISTNHSLSLNSSPGDYLHALNPQGLREVIDEGIAAFVCLYYLAHPDAHRIDVLKLQHLRELYSGVMRSPEQQIKKSIVSIEADINSDGGVRGTDSRYHHVKTY